MRVTFSCHQRAVAAFNAAVNRTIAEDVTQLTELGHILVGAGVPTYVYEIYRSDEGRNSSGSEQIKQRFLVARFLRELADGIEAKGLLSNEPEQTVSASSDLEF